MSSHSSHEMAGKSEPEIDDELVYCVDLPTLQEMASYQVCLSIWYSYISSPRCILKWDREAVEILPYLGAKVTYKGDIDRLIEGLRRPREIEEMLKKWMKKILGELADWAEHLHVHLVPDCIGEYSLLQIDSGWCVWMANGEIDYRKSAQKMLNSGRLDDTQKFVVMSKYCMEDEIKTVSLESLTERIRKLTYKDNSILFYWICYLRNELHKVPLRNASSSLDMSMALQCYRGNVMALQYFWHRSSVTGTNDGGRSLVDAVLNYCADARTWSILERLLISSDSNSSSSYGVERKLKLSSIYSKSSRYPVCLWSRFKHLITNEAFHGLISEMLCKCIHVEEKMELLTHIWDTADDFHRKYILTMALEHSFVQYFLASYSSSATAWQFLYKYLSLLPPEERLRHFHRYRGFMTVFSDVNTLDMWLELCSADRREQSRVKEMIASSLQLNGLLEDSIVKGNFQRLNVLLDWLYSDKGPDVVRALKKQVLSDECNAGHSLIVYNKFPLLSSFDGWKKLSNYIDETFVEDTLQASSLKRSFARSLIKKFNFSWHYRDVFDTAKEIVESVYSSEELEGFKRNLLSDFCVELNRWDYWLYEGKCDERFFQNFMDWCCDNDPVKISQFKSKFPHDVLLTTVLYRLAKCDVYEFKRSALAGVLLDRLQKYLVWYLGSEQSVNDYKLCRINSSSTDLTFFMEKNQSCLMVILKWFFNGSETKINEFMLKTERSSSSK